MGPQGGPTASPSSSPREGAGSSLSCPPCTPWPPYACSCPISMCFATNPGGHVAVSPDSHPDRQQDGRASVSPSNALFTSLSLDMIQLGASVCSSIKGGGNTSNKGVRRKCGEYPTPCLAIKPCSVTTVILKIPNHWALPRAGGGCRHLQVASPLQLQES